MKKFTCFFFILVVSFGYLNASSKSPMVTKPVGPYYFCSATVVAEAEGIYEDCEGGFIIVTATATCTKNRDNCTEAYMAAWLCAHGKAQDAVTEEMPAPCN